MRVNREKLLGILEQVSPGLAPKEMIEQSSCVVFHRGRVCTFNDEISCSVASPIPELTGAVAAKPLLDLLSRMDEDEVDIVQEDKGLLVKGRGKRAKVNMEAEVLLPIDTVEAPEQWFPLPKEFCEAVGIVYSCAAAESSNFSLTCVHIAPTFIEACDRFQLSRYPIESPVDGSVLARAVSLAKIAPLAMTEMALTPAWVHFRNAVGLTFSCRRFLDKYMDLSQFIDRSGAARVALPGSLEEIVNKAEIFSGENKVSNHMLVELRPGKLSIRGEGPQGWYEERRDVAYDGPGVAFLINPKMLLSISKKSNDCCIRPGRLSVDSGKFFYATCTQDPAKLCRKKTETTPEPAAA